jgi:RHS repeat-associated protein
VDGVREGQPFRTDEQSHDAHGLLATRVDNAGDSTGRSRHEFSYDAGDRLQEQRDYGADLGASACVLKRLRYDYDRTFRQEAERHYERTGSECETSVYPDSTALFHRQKLSTSYFASGDVRTQETWYRKDGEAALQLLESHTLSYLHQPSSGSSLYLNGHVVKDTFSLAKAGGSTPCPEASKCVATYAYDARERLVEWNNGLPGNDAVSIKYSLDSATSGVDTLAGDVTREATTTWTNGTASTAYRRFTYGPGGQLQALFKRDSTTGDPDERYHYGPQTGNLKCVTGPAGTSACGTQVLESYTWDLLDRLERFESNRGPGHNATSVYDAFDRLARETDSRAGGATNFAYLGASGAVATETGSDGTKTYEYDALGQRYGMKSGDTAYSYSRNPHSDVSLLLSKTQGAAASYGYRPYGTMDNGLFAGDPNEVNPLNSYRFNDRRLDTGSGSIDMGARRFSPDTGRFLQQDFYRSALNDLELSYDPLTQNRYGFAGGNPLGFVETDGHTFAAEGGGARRESCLRSGRLNCSLGAFMAASWADRGAWLRRMKRSFPLRGWLNVFEGVVKFFGQSRTLKNSRKMKEADGAVLWAIQGGLAAARGGPIFRGLPGSGAIAKWADFFRHLGSDPEDTRGLKNRWGKAEQAGVDFGVRLAGGVRARGKERLMFGVFKEVTDHYRAAIRNNWQSIAHIPIDNFPDIEIPGYWRPDPRRDAERVFLLGRRLERIVDEGCRVLRHC